MPDAGPHMQPEAAPRHAAAPLSDAERLARIEWLADKMDTAFVVPGINWRVGWDSILGLVPGVGDTLTLLPSAYILQQAHAMGAPKRTLTRMALNSGVDWATGLVPLLGDLLDVGFKANRRNARLLRQWLEAENRVPQQTGYTTQT